MSYDNRRYRVVNGILEKSFHAMDKDGWVRTKAEAWAAFNAVPEPEPEIVTGIVDVPDQPEEDEDEPSTVLQTIADGFKRRGRKPLPRDENGNIVRDDADQ